MTTQPLLPFDVCARKHGGNEESRRANLRASKAESRQEVYEALLTHGDMTCKEIAAKLGKPMHKISGRLSELKALGSVEPTLLVRDGGRVLHARRMQ